MYYLVSILLGMIPEVLYFTLFLIYTKNLKEKKIRLAILIGIIYIFCILLTEYKIIYYVVFITLIYFILKILYKNKTQIIDIFIISLSFFYIELLSLLIYLPKNIVQYYIILILNRILLFIPFIFKSKFNILYKKYCSLWNRNYDKKQPIKSITLRNISLIGINCIIFIANIICLYIIKLISEMGWFLCGQSNQF